MDDPVQFHLSKHHSYRCYIWEEQETHPWLTFTQRIIEKGVLYPHMRKRDVCHYPNKPQGTLMCMCVCVCVNVCICVCAAIKDKCGEADYWILVTDICTWHCEGREGREQSPHTSQAEGLYSHPRLLPHPQHTPHWPRSSPAAHTHADSTSVSRHMCKD